MRTAERGNEYESTTAQSLVANVQSNLVQSFSLLGDSYVPFCQDLVLDIVACFKPMICSCTRTVSGALGGNHTAPKARFRGIYGRGPEGRTYTFLLVQVWRAWNLSARLSFRTTVVP